MTDNCRIGPITIPEGYLIETDDHGNGDGTKKFSVVCTPQQALQIQGLITPSSKTQFGNRYFINFDDPNWGLLPIDAGIDLVDNDYLLFRGIGYIITDVTLSSESQFVTIVEITAEEILTNLTDYLNMDYTTGINDGTEQLSDYSSLTAVDQLDEDFSDLAVWTTEVEGTGYTGDFSSAGGKLSVTGKSAAYKTYAGAFLSCTTPATFTAPLYMEVPLEWVSQGAATTQYFSINLFPTAPVTYADYDLTNNLIRIVLKVTPSRVSYYVQKRVNRTWINLASDIPLASTEKSPNFQLIIDSNNLLTVKVDEAGGTTWTTIVSGVSITDVGTGPYTATFGFNNNSAYDFTFTCPDFHIYTYEDVEPLNVVSLPVSTPLTTATFTRASEDGNVNCYASPTGSLLYSTTAANFYKGTVTAYSTNYTDTTSRLITDKNHVLSATKFSVDNGIIKLTTTATGVTLSAWTGAAYTDINTFVIGAVTRLKVTECSPMRFSFMYNLTEWTLEIGKPYCRVSHPNTALTYTRKTCYGHDATTTTDPAADADITMLTVPYATVWSKGTGSCAAPNPADNNRLLFLKQNMCTIKSDSLPADSLTGIGWVDATQNSTSYKDAISIAKEFRYKTRQAIVTE